MIPKRTMYLAFPGMGKTTYAKTHPGVLDLDFGNFRSALKVSPRENGKLYPAFISLAKRYADQGWVILTNEPGLIPLAKQSGFKIVVEVPSDVEELVRRVALRDGKGNAFVKALRSNAPSWVSGWISTARKYKLPLVKGKYFEEVKMPYERRI